MVEEVFSLVDEVFSLEFDVQSLVEEAFSLEFDIQSLVEEVFSFEFDVQSLVEEAFRRLDRILCNLKNRKKIPLTKANGTFRLITFVKLKTLTIGYISFFEICWGSAPNPK
ncbi:MAG: hypothetical protein CFE24_05085 [Flavobacterium sp. BFFFF2]|nr:MAG: hypothetical protein CFE24_05085 [Flavobacterium sp. BFFFF2]